jgi:putative hemolysin
MHTTIRERVGGLRGGELFRPLRFGGYQVRLAVDDIDLRAVQKLRFEVFHDELGEGLPGAAALGLDVDAFDSQCDHLLLESADGEVCGTYRMQTLDRASAGKGFYCDEEFDLSGLPESVLANSIELGRACVAKAHRRGVALFALWSGLAAYLRAKRKDLLFGCCSLTGLDRDVAAAAAGWLVQNGHLDDRWQLAPRPAVTGDGRIAPSEAVAAFKPPPLFGTYLRYGAKVLGGPAFDWSFGTTDFLVLLDIRRLDAKQRALFQLGD